MDDEEVTQAMKEAIAKQRKYAGFFHWHEKRQKEQGILEAFVEAADRVGIQLSDPRLEAEGQDPPDAWATMDGRQVAIEFTEFVDQRMIEKRPPDGFVSWRWWEPHEIAAKVASIIVAKDHDGFGEDVVFYLVLHCDEPALTRDILGRYVQAFPVTQTRGISRCLFLLSYDPSVGSYPLLEVPVGRAA